MYYEDFKYTSDHNCTVLPSIVQPLTVGVKWFLWVKF